LCVTPDELALHNRENDCWIAFRGFVYNVTPYLEFHPGGVDEMMRAAGADGTELFDQVWGEEDAGDSGEDGPEFQDS
jgi:cytochrome-b5 reductase